MTTGVGDGGDDAGLEHVPRYMDEESKRQRIAILNVLAGYYIKLAVKSKDAQRDQFYDLATNNYNKADKIDVQQEMTWVGKGAVSIATVPHAHAAPLCTLFLLVAGSFVVVG
jgi:hypothetical protein